MQIHGRPLTTDFTHPFPLPRPDGSTIVFTLRPLPLGFHRRLRERGVSLPSPPTRVARDSNGRPIRDSNGLAVLVADEHDPDYQNRLEQYHQRVAVLTVAESLSADPDVRFDTPAPADDGDWPAYADALYDELERSGFTAGDLIRLCQETCRISNLLDDDLRETERNFSPPPTAAASKPM